MSDRKQVIRLKIDIGCIITILIFLKHFLNIDLIQQCSKEYLLGFIHALS